MGILGFAVLGILVIFMLAGIYKGFVWNLAALCAAVAALIIAAVFSFFVSKGIVKNQGLFSAMLSYTEGSEAIYDIELVNKEITSLSNAQIEEVMVRSNLPFPLRDRVYNNIMNESLKSRGITTLGDYFNYTIVYVIINIVSFMLLYFIFRIIFTFAISWMDYIVKFKKLRLFDPVAGAAIGIVRGFIDISILFMITPAVLMVLPFEQIEELLTASSIATYLHRSNIILKLIPGIV